MKIKELVVKYFLKDYLKAYVKPLFEKIISFLDGKKTLLSLILFGAATYAQGNPTNLVSQIILEIVRYAEITFAIPVTLDGLQATAIITAVVGLFDKLRKWATKK